MDSDTTGNFSFLQEHDPVFYQLAHAAEQLFPIDPKASLVKLRQLAEALAQHIATQCGIMFDDRTPKRICCSKFNERLISSNPFALCFMYYV